ncbi:T9SS type B sorting domain-containing protein [Aureibacter tunicatorum]|uniref:PKD domain-containing protein n=1 Tax=Aureibacter tunicatorum TaxID=866807 RepID=A0AAE3XPT2_9BACT|nr:gliding motility-associated C-terminal domain-containing protein [Aureibacter tunicatorum]MDR6239104.1 hypothetical protein [Aureibacter tunicatorum]BDD04970.1 hypothetical protein AUTU_24530 [Aureibacter tunicatorum]
MNNVGYIHFALKLVLFLFIFPPLHAQQNSVVNNNEWYLSEHRLIVGQLGDEYTDSLHISPNNLNENGNTAVAFSPLSDELLFYSDGETIYNRNHLPMEGISINNSSGYNQRVAIAKSPNNPNHYYLYVNYGNVDIYTIDMSDPGGGTNNLPFGRVINRTQNAINNTSEGMHTFSSENNQYLLTQTGSEIKIFEIGDNSSLTEISSYPLASNSIQNISTYSTDNEIIILSSPKGSNQSTRILSFNPQSNSIEAHEIDLIPNTGGATGTYDAEMINDSIVYISSSNDIYEYNLNQPNAPIRSIKPFDYEIGEGFGLQKASNGKVYFLHSREGQSNISLAVIQPEVIIADNPMTPDVDESEESLPFEFNTAKYQDENIGAKQFPSFLPEQEQEDITFNLTQIGKCTNEQVKLVPQLEKNGETIIANEYTWLINGEAYDAAIPSISFEQASASVTLIATINGQEHVFNENISLIENPLVPDSLITNLDGKTDTTICKSQIPFTLEGTNAEAYRWSTEETTQNIEVSTSGRYWLTAAQNGCTANFEVNVQVFEEELPEEQPTIGKWYFGNSAGIDFDNPPNDSPRPLDNSLINSPSGAETVYNEKGDVIFYTDGENIWGDQIRDGNDNTHEEIDNNIGGQFNSSQAVKVMMAYQESNKYYVFTTESVESKDHFDLKVTVVNVTGVENSTPIEILTEEKDQLLFTKNAERIAVTGGGNSPGWMVTHDYSSNTFRAYPIDTMGIGNPVYNHIGAIYDVSNNNAAIGEIEFSGDGSKIAVAYSTNEGNFIELFDFDQETGQMSNYAQIPLGEDDLQAYGLEFSPDNRKVFVTLKGESRSVLKEAYIDYSSIDIDGQPTPNPDYLEEILDPSNVSTVANISGEAGHISTAPNNQIYVAINGSQSLGSIQPNSEKGQSSNFNENGLDLGGNTSTLGLPSYTTPPPSNSSQEPSLTVDGNCLGIETEMSASGKTTFDVFNWNFGNGLSAQGMQLTDTSQIYQSPSEYIVQVRITNKCGMDTTLFQNIEIFENPDEPTVGNYGICNDIEIQAFDNKTDNELSALDITWTDFESGDVLNGNTISVTPEDKVYILEVSNEHDCKSSDTVTVLDYRPNLELSDLSICQDEEDHTLSTSLSERYGHRWFINNIPQNTETNSSIQINASIPGEYYYKVEVIDPDNPEGCVTTDSALIIINANPQLTASTTNTQCGDSDGTITLNGNSTFDYAWEDDTNINSNVRTDLASGIYNVIITNINNGCTQEINNITVDDDANYDFTSNDSQIQCNGDLEIEVESSNTSSDFQGTYTINSPSGEEIDNGNVSINVGSSHPFNVTNQNLSGEYNISFIDNSGCQKSVKANVLAKDSIEINLNTTELVKCSNDDDSQFIIENHSPENKYTWYDINGNSSNDNPYNPQSGNGEYRLVATPNDPSTGKCPSEIIASSTTYNTPDIDFDITDDFCNDGFITLNGTINSNGQSFREEWFVNNSNSPDGFSSSFIHDESGEHTYTYKVTETTTLCSNSVTKDYENPTLIEFALNAKPACLPADENPIELEIDLVSPENDDNIIYEFYLNKDDDLPSNPNNESIFITDIFEIEEGKVIVKGEGDKVCEAEQLFSVSRETEDITLKILVNQNNQVIDTLQESGNLIVVTCTYDSDPDSLKTLNTLSSLYSNYHWKNKSNDFESNESTLELDTEEKIGLYNLTVESLTKCEYKIDFTVSQNCRPTLVLPNAFTPSQLNNRVFRIAYDKYISDDGFECYIYNRWGELIFYSDDYQSFKSDKSDLNFNEGGWQGTTQNGDDVQQGVYTFIIKYKSIFENDPELYEKRGSVILLK